MNQIDLSEFEQKLLYKFNDINILDEALCHSSFVNEQNIASIRDNERFEFLGDAVLSLIVGHILMQRYPDINEGDLSRNRSSLVNESMLATIARTIDLGLYIQLGKGEIRTNGREKNSILADTFEAVIAAVYLDGGFDAVFKVINIHFLKPLDSIAAPTSDHDYKSRLQELVQVGHRAMSHYSIIHESGPDHDKTFKVRLKVSKISTEGIGKSKKMAEQDAAKRALEILKKE